MSIPPLQNNLPELDTDGHLLNYQAWSPDVAQHLADSLQVTLTQDHHQILRVTRDFYTQFQHAPATRPLIKYLQRQLPDMAIDNAKLQRWFNTGLVARHVSRIAGLPKPANCL